MAVCTDVFGFAFSFILFPSPFFQGHVVMFDFPRNPVDYIHRAGRTARAGAKGKVTSLVVKGDRVLANRIDDADLNI